MVVAPLDVLKQHSEQFAIDGLHIGFKLGRKVGNAVKRNLFRRRIKFLLRGLDNPQSFACIFIARSGSVDLSYQLLRREFENCALYISSKI